MAQRAKQLRLVPWAMGIQCQQFFKLHAASRWFKVGCGSKQPGSETADIDNLVGQLKRVHEAQAKQFRRRRQDNIHMADAKTEPNAWLDFISWVYHLEGLDAACL